MHSVAVTPLDRKSLTSGNAGRHQQHALLFPAFEQYPSLSLRKCPMTGHGLEDLELPDHSHFTHMRSDNLTEHRCSYHGKQAFRVVQILRGDSLFSSFLVVHTKDTCMHLSSPKHPHPAHPVVDKNHEPAQEQAVLMLRTPSAVCIVNTKHAPRASDTQHMIHENTREHRSNIVRHMTEN